MTSSPSKFQRVSEVLRSSLVDRVAFRARFQSEFFLGHWASSGRVNQLLFREPLREAQGACLQSQQVGLECSQLLLGHETSSLDPFLAFSDQPRPPSFCRRRDQSGLPCE
eukprot:CAMPEP_0198330954 /NCGR_PEP_ID=MMETSP1450-20131203/17258_1 /TAXON_ID=753684 ORGANISM="Madagascaria erythrocladiodes, Strain CCMP3234" /NCGR_SAMPLE_ID=MMETSP1450 /ASSEMBLY_ACC=CAM_ASM_001115 /LENGTH=109 /DNA_ID=CAMNT_0044035289 /DNA_START=308 /DNA_END=637 /DNA_ORIENTATION=+